MKFRNESGYWVDEDGEYTHRNVYRAEFGPIPSGYDVHHINMDKENNRSQNLIALPRAFHKWFHENFRRLQWSEDKLHGTYCEKSGDLIDGICLKTRRGVEKHLALWKSIPRPSVSRGRKTILRKSADARS